MPEQLPEKLPYNNGEKRDYSNYTGIKHIMRNNSGGYYISRRGIHYGTYDTIIDAVKEKLFWESVGWDFDLLYYH